MRADNKTLARQMDGDNIKVLEDYLRTAQIHLTYLPQGDVRKNSVYIFASWFWLVFMTVQCCRAVTLAIISDKSSLVYYLNDPIYKLPMIRKAMLGTLAF
jgi:hypothetical protein